ncbi:arylsulfatase [Flavobacterium collinsii]|uniref:arylsulfatase n=1 Tax=Flavobacterium collinsii TaxID=1114861 RepID=UPI0022BC2288|nr:arylsulfatase [Flavobacterium collinsii]GIQ57334.1 arylsulfatase [Flavobacterium collinsii]
MKKTLLTLNVLLSTVLLVSAQNKTTADSSKPNIILIMVDDMGYSDLGNYGSEIKTPNLDKLASEGLRLREFYNNSICAPTRASLLTGQYQHKAGMGFFDINLGLPAYQGYLNKESLTLGEVFRSGGYSTLLSGKWHVGSLDQSQWPNQRGFDKFYGILKGASNYFDAKPLPFGKTPYPVKLLLNNEELHPKDDSYYFTDEIGNIAVSFLDEQNKENKPFFLYLAFTAPHWPLQAKPVDIAKYKGKFDEGWDVLREKRIERLKANGILPANQTVSSRDPEVPEWSKLTYDEKQFWKAKMEVYAAMVDNMDQNVGKVLNKLKALKKDKNTLIIFISDNGAQGGFNTYNPLGRGLVRNDGPIGTSGSFDYQEQNWAYLSNTPLQQYKNNMHEGGFSSPFIAWFPSKIKSGRIDKGTGHIIDLAPTFYELAGIEYPKEYNSVKSNPLAGKSLLPVLFDNASEVNRGAPLFWERAGNRAVRDGKWKLVSTYPSYEWELYNIETDRGETTNVAQQNPAVVNKLSASYFDWADQTGVVEYSKFKLKQEVMPGGAALKK